MLAAASGSSLTRRRFVGRVSRTAGVTAAKPSGDCLSSPYFENVLRQTALRREGKTLAKIGLLFGVSRQRVNQLLKPPAENKRAGRPRRDRTPSHSPEEQETELKRAAHHYRVQVRDKFTYLNDGFEIDFLVNSLLDDSKRRSGLVGNDADPLAQSVSLSEISITLEAIDARAMEHVWYLSTLGVDNPQHGGTDSEPPRSPAGRSPRHESFFIPFKNRALIRKPISPPHRFFANARDNEVVGTLRIREGRCGRIPRLVLLRTGAKPFGLIEPNLCANAFPCSESSQDSGTIVPKKGESQRSPLRIPVARTNTS